MTEKSSRRASRSIHDIEVKMRSCKSRSDRVHVLASKNGWAVKREGSQRADRLFDRKSDAISRARSLLRTRNVIVHKKDGTIESWQKARKTPRE